MAREQWILTSLLIVVIVGDLVRNCQLSDATASCNVPSITPLNFKYYIEVWNGTNRTLSCEIQSDTQLIGDPVWRLWISTSTSTQLPKNDKVENGTCAVSTKKTCVQSNLTLINVVQHVSGGGNYSLTAENDCGNASVYVYVSIKVPEFCTSNYSKSPPLKVPPPSIVQVVQDSGSITIQAEYEGNGDDNNLIAYWCITSPDGSKYRCILPSNNNTDYNVTIDPCPPDECCFKLTIKIEPLTLDLSGTKFTSIASWFEHSSTGNSTLVVYIYPALDSWDPKLKNECMEVDEGQSIEFICVYNASTNHNVTITTWKFDADLLEHNSSHYTMTTRYGNDPINFNHVLSKLLLSDVIPDNAGTYVCQCAYSSHIIYNNNTNIASGANSFCLTVKPGKQSYTEYIIIGGIGGAVSLVVIIVLILLCLFWRVRKHFKKLHKTPTENQHGAVDGRGDQSNHEDGQNSVDSDDDEHCSESTPLLSDEQSRPLKDFAADTNDLTDDSKSADQPNHQDQLISGQQYSNVPKGAALTPSHRKVNRQQGQMITGTTAADSTSGNTTTSTTTNVTTDTNSASATVKVSATGAATTLITATTANVVVHNYHSAPLENMDTSQPSTTEDERRKAKLLPVRPDLNHLPTDYPIASEVEGPTAPSGGKATNCTDKPTIKSLSGLIIKEVAPKWRDLGRLLLKEEWTDKLNAIEKNDLHNVQECCHEVLEYWLNNSQYEPTWDKLTNALKQLRQDTSVAMIERDESIKGTDRPSIILLLKYVRDQVAPRWRDLGIQLLEKTDMLDIIAADHPHGVQSCCTEMLEYWLHNDHEASWSKLISALEQIGRNVLAANIKKNVVKVNKQKLPHSSTLATETLVSASNHPDNASQSVTSGSYTQDVHDQAPGPKQLPVKPLLCHLPTDHSIECEQENPQTSKPAKRNILSVESTTDNASVSKPEVMQTLTPSVYCTPITEAGDNRRVLNLIAPDFTVLVNMETLLPFLQKHDLLTSDEEYHLMNIMYSPTERAQKLLGYLKHKGDRSLQKILCCLNSAGEHAGHKELAEKLKRIIQSSGIDCGDFCSASHLSCVL